MSRYVVFVMAAVIFLHGLLHLIGFAAYWRLAELDAVPYKTAILHGQLHLNDLGMRIFGTLFLLAAAAFVMVAIGMWNDTTWWRALLFGAALLSLAITALDWQVAYAGAVVDLVVLGAMAITRAL